MARVRFVNDTIRRCSLPLALSHAAAVAAGTQRLVDDEEFSWLAFGGSDDVSITSLATAGSRSVAVGGSGGKLEIWDVEAVFREVGRTRKGARAGLVRRLVSTGVRRGIGAENRLDSTAKESIRLSMCKELSVAVSPCYCTLMKTSYARISFMDCSGKQGSSRRSSWSLRDGHDVGCWGNRRRAGGRR